MGTIKFKAQLQPRGPAAAVVLDDAQVAAVGEGPKRFPVVATINGYTWRTSVARMGGEFLVGLNREVRQSAGVQAGDEVDVTIELDTAPRDVEVPAALAAALAADPRAKAAFDGMAFTHRKEYARWVAEAKRKRPGSAASSRRLKCCGLARPFPDGSGCRYASGRDMREHAAMTNAETIERVRELRQRGRTPKEIARALGLPPAAVAPLIRAVAAAQPAREAALVGCWVSQGWAAGLTVNGHPDWPGAGAGVESGESGLVSILVARDAGSRVSVCGYLVDAWCLGVKNALGPKSMDRRKLPEFRDWFFRSYEEPPMEVPLDLVRHVVFGAVGYARGLGFEPHPDFAGCVGHLGRWEGSSDVTFGREGKPMYIEGPNDDAAGILRTLRRSVGDGNFHYVCELA